MGYIKQVSIDRVMDTVQIEEVVGDHVQLKKSGSNLTGLCPFHNEKTPSFVVSPAKGIYKCFGCQEAGNAVNFLMNLDGLSYPEAIRSIAKKYAIELEEFEETEASNEERDHRELLFTINEYAQNFYEHNLHETDYGKSIGLSYFKNRGYPKSIMERFGLGFSGSHGNFFIDKALKDGYTKEQLEACGLVKNNRDFFRNRVIFTISNLSGKPIAFAGRILDSKAKAPKYINSPETAVYNKSRVLYGLFQARKGIKKKDECYLVEGYTDVISLHMGGVENVVASSGTSLTEDQIRLIKRFTPNVTMLYDGDKAGIKAALRGVDLILAQDLNVRVVVLPDGEDPDSYIQKLGNQEFEAYVDNNKQDVILFKTNLLLDDAKGDPVKKASVVKEILKSIAVIPNQLKQVEYLKVCSENFSIPQDILLTELRKVVEHKSFKKPIQTSTVIPQTEAAAVKKVSLLPSFEKDLLRVLILFGEEKLEKQAEEEEELTIAEFILSEVEDVMDKFVDPVVGNMFKLSYESLLKGEILPLKFYTNHSDADIQQMAITLVSEKHEYSKNWSERFGIELTTQKKPSLNFDADARKVLIYFKMSRIKQLIAEVDEKILSDEENMAANVALKTHLLEIRKKIAKELGTVVF